VPWLDRVELIRVVRPLGENSTFPFFMLSGMLLTLVNSQIDYKSFLLKRAKTVALPYVIAVIPVAIIFLFYSDLLTITNQIYLMKKTSLIESLTSGRNSINIAMWFFPVICTFFLIMPFFRYLYQRPRLLIAFIVFTFLLSNFTHRPATTGEFLRSCLYFLFPYSLGMLMGRFFVETQYLLKKCVVISFALFVLVYYIQVQYGPIGGLDRYSSIEQMSLAKPDYSLLQKLFLTLFLMGLFLHYDPPRWVAIVLQQISKYAFGLHLYHGYFITAYVLAFGQRSQGHGIGMFLAQFLLVVLVCYIFCRTIYHLSPKAAELLFSTK
jgi:surface polysaccharide O-acyltransferase-like enzyme